MVEMQPMNWLKSFLSFAISSSESSGDSTDPRKAIFPNLTVTQLETRRVLNGDGLTSELIVDAGADAADGNADSFQLQIDQDQVEVSVNGRVIRQVSTETLRSIRLQGSSDQDNIHVDWNHSGDSDLEIYVDGGGGDSDQLTLASFDRVERLIHTLESESSGQIQIQQDGISSGLRYSGISTIDHRVQSDDLAVRVESEFSDLNLQAVGRDGENGATDQTRLTFFGQEDAASGATESFVMTFVGPSDQFTIDAQDGGLVHVEMDGLGASFNADLELHASGSDLVFSGNTSFEGGNAFVRAGSIQIDASLTSDGGDFRFESDQMFLVSPNGIVDSRGGAISIVSTGDDTGTVQIDGTLLSQGGHVSVDSGEHGVSLVRGLIDVSETREGELGGTVHVLGVDVTLSDSARVDASGSAGGGTILIGGDYQGRNPAIANADRSQISRGAVLIASGSSKFAGGGRIIVWADGQTKFDGSAIANGGEQGRGGFVEISGKSSLAFGGSVDVTSDSGETGTLLLDPKNIVIDDGAGTTDATTTYLSAASLVTLLDSANVDLLADNDITVSEAVDALANTGNHSLTLTSGRSIFLQQDISLRGSFTATANAAGQDALARDAGAAEITMGSGVDLFTNLFGDDITIVMSNGFNSGGNLSGNISIDDIDAGTGTLTVTNNGETDGSSILRSTVGSNVLAQVVNLSIDDITAGDGVTNVTGTIGTSGANILLENITSVAVVNDAAETFIDDKDLDLAGTTLTSVTSSSGTFSYEADGAVTVETITATGEVVIVAGSGNVTLADNAINAGGDVRLTASSGGIIDQDANATTNVTTSGTLVLSAATGIGSTGVGAIDTDAVGLAAQTTANGDIFLSETSGLIIRSGTIGGGTGTITGVASGSGDITITSASGALQFDEDVSGENITITATGSFEVAAGKQILAGGNGTALTINAESITFNDSTRNNEAVRNIGTGTIELVTSGGDITLGDYSIRIDSADLIVNAGTDDIVVSNVTGVREIEADALVELTAGAIGTSTERLEIDNVTDLIINDTAVGNIFVQEFGADTIVSTTINVTSASLGTINVDYNNADEIEIGSSHAITSVVHHNAATDRNLTYLALDGDITLQDIDVGTADVSITAQAGSIHESGVDPSVDIAADELTLTARDEIGSSVAAIDLDVSRLTAQTTVDGGIFLSEADGLIIDGAGVTTSGDRDIMISSGGGTLQVTQTIDAGSGNIQLDGATVDIDASITGRRIDINASASVDVASGSQVIASGAGDLAIDATSIRLNAGGSGTETVSHTGTGVIALTSTAGNLTLDHHAIGRSDAGAISIDVQDRSIVLVNNSGTEEIDADGSLALTAGTVGTSTRALDLAGVTTLTVTDTAAGLINIAELGSATITATDITVDDVGYGTIDISYIDGEIVDINDNHVLQAVDFSTNDRVFNYTATVGDVEINSVDTGAASVKITASAGSIAESANDSNTNVTTLGTLTLIASSGIGDGVGVDALDLQVGTVAANMTGSGDVFLTGANGLIVGSGDGVNGISTAGSGVNVNVVANGDLTVSEAITAGTGNVTLSGTAVNVANDITGAEISISATGALSVSSGNHVVASGVGNDVVLDAASISLAAGASGNETVRSAAGDVAISTTGGALSLDHHAIAVPAGNLSIDVGTNVISVAQTTGTEELNVGGGITLTAAEIGSSTNALDIAGATSLVLTDTGAGAIYLAEQTANTILQTDVTVGDHTYGIINLDFHDDDEISIGDAHAINSVDQTHSDRAFHYTALQGDVTIGAISTIASDLSVTTLDGTITDINVDSVADLSTAGTVTLNSSKAIGSLVGQGALDVTAGVLAAASTSEGDIAIATLSDVTVGAGTGINGISAATGGNVHLSSTGTISASVGIQIIAGGDGTDVTLQANRIDLTSGSAGVETVRNDETGTVTLNSTGQDIQLDHHSVGSASGIITIDAGTQQILVSQPSGTAEINTAGEVRLTGSAMGNSVNSLEIAGATSLTIDDTGAGEIHIAELNANTITSTSVTVGNVGFGTIDVDYFDSDVIDLQGDHTLSSVVHQNFNRSFEYTATVGSILIADSAINTGSGDVTLTATSGAIAEAGNNGTRDITSSGILTLVSATGIGTAGTGAIDIDVAQLAAQTTSSGGVYLNEVDSLIIGSGDGVNGITTVDGPIVVDSAGGTLQVTENIGAGAGDVTLRGGNIAIDADVQGENLVIEATGSFSLSAASKLIPGGQDTSLSILASSITVSDGTVNDETIKNTGNGSVSLTATSGDVALGSFAVASDSGSINVSAALGSVIESTSNDDRSIETTGTLTINVLNSVGSTGGTDVNGSGPLDVAVGTVIANSSGSGGIFLKDTGGLTLANVDTASGDIEIRSSGTIRVTDVDASGTVTLYSTGGDVLLSDSAIQAGSFAVNLTAEIGEISETSSTGVTSITTTNALSLSAGTGVGTSTNALNLSVQSVAAETSDGGIFLQDNDGLTIDTGDNGVAGLTAGNDSPVQINVDSGTLLINESVDAGLGDVLLTATNITVDADVQGGQITVDADDTIQVLSGNQIQTNVSGAGALTIEAQTVSVQSGGSTKRSLSSTSGGDISITATAGNVSLGSDAIDAGSGAVQISSTDSIVELTATSTTSIYSTDTLTLIAANSIGSTGGIDISGQGPLDISVSQLDARISGAGGIFLRDEGGLTLTNVDGASGNIEIRSSGSIAVEDVDNSGTVRLIADTGNLTLNDGAIVTTMDVFLTATAGSIEEATPSSTVNVTTSGTLSLVAGTGIGADVSTAIDTSVATLVGQATTAGGGIFVRDVDGLVIGSDTSGNSGLQTNGGTIAIESSTGGLQIDESVSGGTGDVTLSGATVSVNSNVSGGSLDVQATGAVTVAAGSRLIGGGNGTAIDVQGASITIQAGADTVETIQNSGTGSISLTASSGDVLLPEHGIATDSGSITVVSQSGSILELTAGTNTTLSTSGTLTLSASNAVGGSGIDQGISTDVGSIAAQSTTGGIFLNELNDLIVDSGDTVGGSVVSGVTSASGAISITSGSGTFETRQSIDGGNQSVDLVGQNFLIGSNIVGGSINIDASGTLTVSNGSQIIGGGNSTAVTVSAATVSLNGGGSGSETIRNTGDGTVSVSVSTGDFSLQQGAIGVEDGDVSITATAGAIVESSSGTSTGIVTSGVLTLSAFTGIGTSGVDGEIDTAVGTIAASTTTGGIYLSDSGNLKIGQGAGGIEGITSNSGGDIRVTASGTLQVDQAVNAGAGSVELTGSMIQINATTQGVNSQINSSGNVQIASGVQVLAGGDATSLSISAAAVQIGTGADGAETLKNSGTGTVSISAASGDIDFNHFSIGNQQGAVTVDAGTNSINVASPTGTSEISSQGAVSVSAAIVGNASNALDLNGATSLSISDTGAGSIFLAELTASTITSTTVVVGDLGYGTVDVDFFDNSEVDIGGDHVLTVLHDATDRDFTYIAGSGDIRLSDNAVDAGNADVSISALNGSILEDTTGTAINITTTGSVTLEATGSIGGSGVNESIDTQVGTIAVQSTSASGIYLREVDDVEIGTGAGAIDGIISSGGDVSVSAGGAIAVTQNVSAGAGQISLSAIDLTVDATISGNVVNLAANNDVSISDGNRLLADGSGVAIAVSSATITIGAGSSNTETLQSTGSGSIDITSTSGPISLAAFAIASDTGTIVVDAGSDAIVVANPSGDSEIRSLGSLELSAAAIGSATNSLEVEGVNELTIHDRGAGEIHVSELGSATIQQTTIAVGGNSFGTIDIDYSNSDTINIDDGNQLILVDHRNGNRGFEYSASAGDVLVSDNAIDTGSGDVVIKANTGSILEASVGTAVNITTTGSLSLSAATGIGSSTTDGALDIQVQSVAAETTGSGGIFLSELDAVTITSAATGVSGLTTAGGDIQFTSSSGATILEETIDAGSGTVNLTAESLTAQSDIVGDQISINATGSVDVQAGNQLIANSSTSAITLVAGSVNLQTGSSGNETLLGNAAGEISIAAVSGNITLDSFAIRSVAGTVDLNASSGDILVANSSSDAEINSNGAVVLEASAIGSSTQSLDMEGATSFSVTDNGPGGIYLAELNSATISSTSFVVQNGAGTIDVAFSDSDSISIGDSHSIASVQLDSSGRDFLYQATTGDITLDDFSINTGSGKIVLNAVSGAILESSPSTDVKITTTSSLTLIASSDIGGSAIDHAIDTNVATLAVQTTGIGSVFIDQVGGLVVGSGENGVDGVATAGGDITITSGADDFRVASELSSAGGSIILRGTNLDIDANVSGGTIDLSATDDIVVKAGAQITSASSGTDILIQGSTIQLGDGADGSETVKNIGTGSVTLSTVGGDIQLGQFSIGAESGDVVLSASTQGIFVSQVSGSAEIAADGLVDITAAFVGSSGSRLEVSGATSLNVRDTGSGGIHLGEVGVATVTETSILVDNTGFGTIDVAYSNLDAIDINDSHTIESVVHHNANRDFNYTATVGDISINSIDAGTGDVTLIATDGLVGESSASSATNVTAETLTISSSQGVGSSGASEALDINATTLAAQTTVTGGIYLNEVDDVVVGSGASGVTGLTTANDSDIVLTSASGTLQITQSVNSGGGDITIQGNSLDADADILGATIAIHTSGDVDVGAGNRISSTNGAIEITSDLGAIILNEGSDGNETVSIQSAGTIDLNAASIVVDHHSIRGEGQIVLNAGTGVITVSQTTGTVEIDNIGSLTLTASSIGTSTNQLEFSGATSLILEDTGGGEIHLAEVDGTTIQSASITVAGNAMGSINIDFDNSDVVVINDSHDITNVDLKAGDRDFQYAAVTGDISVSTIRVGSGDVFVSADAGSITESSTDSVTDIQSDGTLTLRASGDIGGSGLNEAIDIDVQIIAAETTGTGSIYLNEANDVIVATGVNSIQGITSNGGDLILTAAGTLQVDDAIDTNSGSLSIIGNDFDLNSDLQGGNVSLDSSGALNLASGTHVIAGGDSTTLTITASTIDIEDGTSSQATVQNSGSGGIGLSATGGNIDLGDHAIEGGSGDTTIAATSGSIDERNDNSNPKISTSGHLILQSQSGIGESSNNGAQPTQPLDVLVGSLSANVSGVGGIFISDSDGLNIQGLSTADGSIEIESSGDLVIENAVTANGGGDVVLSGSKLAFLANGDVTSASGELSISASTSGGLSFDNDTLLSTSQGQVSGQLFNSTNPFANSSNVGSPLSDSNRDATINVALDDSFGTNITVEVDFAEGDTIIPTPVAPPQNLRAQFVQGEIAVATTGLQFSHTYENAPDPSNPSADINIGLSITQLAGGAIQLLSGGQSVLAASTFASQSLVIEVSAPILPFFISIPETDVAQLVAPTIQIAGADRVLQRVFVTESPQELINSIGTTNDTAQRYYVLRIVSFGDEGEVKLTQEGQEYRLRDMSDSDSESGFELSQLPELFKRLPDDRYRIYLIDGQTERLVLDFIIRDGQPIEAQNEEDAAVLVDSEQTETIPQSDDVDSEEAMLNQISEEIKELGKTPIVTSGGVLLTAGMLMGTEQRPAINNRNANGSKVIQKGSNQ